MVEFSASDVRSSCEHLQPMNRCISAVLCFTAAAGVASACSIPVFRYALDHWRPDSYRLQLDRTPSAEEPELDHLLRNLGDHSSINLQLIASTDGGSTSSRLLFPKHGTEIWSGTLDTTNFNQLVDSPARAEIARRLADGQSGVWIVIESGNKELDDAHTSRLKNRVAFLQTAATLPMIDPSDPSNQLGPGPELRIDFSILRLVANDARESLLKKMLLGPTQEISMPSTEPVAAVVFGRGRVLGVWPMETLGDDAIDSACLYLLGACSCQVKQMNPGWDLLLSFNWDEHLQEFAETHAPRGGKQFDSSPTETVVFEGAAPSSQGNPNQETTRRGIFLVMATAALLAAGFIVRRMR